MLRWRRSLAAAGEPVTWRSSTWGTVLDVHYRVQRPADRSGAGHLSFVAARAPWGRRRWRAFPLPRLML